MWFVFDEVILFVCDLGSLVIVMCVVLDVLWLVDVDGGYID